jgi:putative tryptophan/tyrosine transport system substrate-binding protein
MGGKWVEILRELIPSIKQIGFLYNPGMAPYFNLYFRTVQQAAQSLNIKSYLLPVEHDAGIRDALSAHAKQPDNGLIVLQDAFTATHRDFLIAEAARNRIPALYAVRLYAVSGGLVSQGVDFAYQFLQAANYVDRVLKGAHPGQLPVQQPTKFELVINLKTAMELGLTVPPFLLARADEVIE